MDKIIKELKIIGGFNKIKEKEDIDISLKPGDVYSVVGKTGAGKSRLLSDICCLAQGDTLTGRKILINGEAPFDEERYSIDENFIAEISQNMNSIMDLTVEDFIIMHSGSNQIYGDITKIDEVVECANTLISERFKKRSSLVQLSPGQSKALMIAEVALLSNAQIIVIDELENVAVDKKKVLDLLIRENKIIIMSTHDPILTFSCNKRILIEDGGISKVIETSEKEKKSLEYFFELEEKMTEISNGIDRGEYVDGLL